MKIALIQTNPVLGDFQGNLARIIARTQQAQALGCQLAILPELALSGYPPQDLLQRPAFLADHDRALTQLIAAIQGIGVVCGAITRNHEPYAHPWQNSALLFRDQEVLFSAAKRRLSSSEFFDESRYFAPGQATACCHYQGLRLTISIGEDIWDDQQDSSQLGFHRLVPSTDLLINLAATPFVMGANRQRQQNFAKICGASQSPLIHVNQVGGQDSLIFAGGSLALNHKGQVICRATEFEEDLVILDSATWQGEIRKQPSGLADLGDPEAAEALQALTLGVRDYVRKCGFTGVVIGLSGGIDSALVAVIAVRALGPENVLGIGMPSPYSSPASLEDAQGLAANLGIAFKILPINSILIAYQQTLATAFMHQPGKVELTEQNIQARIRGNLLMAAANKFHRLVLATGNKSELAVGYCTIYGDLIGALAPLADVPKTLVYRLAQEINQTEQLIPARTLKRAPSAELAPNQSDQDDLPPYEVLDPILRAYLEDQRPIGEIIALGFAQQTVIEVIKLVQRSEHKRRQAPPGLKISSKPFGFGRNPLAENYRESQPEAEKREISSTLTFNC